MKKPVIAVDLDDVLGDQKEAVRLFANRRFGHDHTAEAYEIEAPYWGFWEAVWGVDTEEGIRRFDEFVKAGGHLKQQTLPEATRVIAKLGKSFELVIVTSRMLEHAEETHEWLETHFPKTFKGVEFVSVWGDSKTHTKAKICKEIGAEYLIDDHFDHCKLAAEEGVTALLFGDYGWNRSAKETEGMVRVKDWKAVERYFDGLKR